ncbi:MAG: hypothetical protein GKR90_16185 [Pseudomonadales bacterium]|nr:hypothetical protein [Pseudomonadales bacterium]
MVDPTHSISALYNLVNVPSAVWIDESGRVRRIDEGAYAAVNKMGDFEFGRADYAPMVADWVANGDQSQHVSEPGELQIAAKSDEAARADAAFRLGNHFKAQNDEGRAEQYWQLAQQLNPDSWNYHRQDWAYTPEEAGANWQQKVQTLGDKPYYKPIEGLDEGE